MSSSSLEMPDAGTPFIILGADAVLAALPSSPVQLAHACHALGFELAAPATWGDELIAESCLQQLTAFEHPTAIMCSCPLVTERLTRSSTTLEPFMLTFVSPPVATARYLRAAYEGQPLHITYVGACPGADDASIDARLLPSQLLEAFAERGIVVGEQPKSFDALVPLDRRRFFSLPGGTPSSDHVDRCSNRALLELAGDDVVLGLTQHLIEHTPALVDLALPLGCACAGAGDHARRGKPRAALLLLEPPRARQKVLDPSLRVDVSQTLVDACALHATGSDTPTAVEASADAEAHPASALEMAPSDVAPIERPPMDTVPMDLVAIESPPIERPPIERPPIEMPPIEMPPIETRAETSGRRSLIFRSSESVPQCTTGSGDVVPRASLALLRRAIARAAARNAKRLPKIERGRRDHAVDLLEASIRPVSRTSRALAVPVADLPLPVPPPPARHRPRTLMEI
ncbi:MAG TPA: hypothetical protein VKP02_13340 [Gemmatimonadaceae bacterium]|nr:hypothetical protein [Gemmatimonadaceae bacterium]